MAVFVSKNRTPHPRTSWHGRDGTVLRRYLASGISQMLLGKYRMYVDGMEWDGIPYCTNSIAISPIVENSGAANIYDITTYMLWAACGSHMPVP